MSEFLIGQSSGRERIQRSLLYKEIDIAFFKVGAVGPLFRFIGLEIKRPGPGVVAVSKKMYINNILKGFNVELEVKDPITELMYQELMHNKVSMSLCRQRLQRWWNAYDTYVTIQ